MLNQDELRALGQWIDAQAKLDSEERADETLMRKLRKAWSKTRRAMLGIGVALLLTGCGRLASTSPNDDGGDPIAHEAAAPSVDASVISDAGNLPEAGFQSDTDAGESTGPDAGNPSCAPDECDCNWLASSCANYAEKYPCGTSAACAQTFDLDPTTCTRSVHTASTDAGSCLLHDDGVTWCCP